LGPRATLGIHGVLIPVLVVSEAPAPRSASEQKQQHNKDDEHHGQYDADNHSDGFTPQSIPKQLQITENYYENWTYGSTYLFFDIYREGNDGRKNRNFF
jgi:hypothetical protein